MRYLHFILQTSPELTLFGRTNSELVSMYHNILILMCDEIYFLINRIFKLAMVVITSLYMTFGVCGYLSFGEETKSIITLNLPNGKFHIRYFKLCFQETFVRWHIINVIGNEFFFRQISNNCQELFDVLFIFYVSRWVYLVHMQLFSTKFTYSVLLLLYIC